MIQDYVLSTEFTEEVRAALRPQYGLFAVGPATLLINGKVLKADFVDVKFVTKPPPPHFISGECTPPLNLPTD